MNELDCKCYRCKACGGILIFWADGTIGHNKPKEKLNVPNSVRCATFYQLTSAKLRSLYRDAEEIPGPVSIESGES